MLKKLLSLLRNQVVLLVLALLILLLAVFLVWPLIGVATVHRQLTLLLLGLVGLILILVSTVPQAIQAYRHRRASMGSLGAELERVLAILAEECPGRGGLYKVERVLRLPWVLVLGSPGSGKSKALAHASFARPFTDPAASSPLCTFWLAQDVVFVHPRQRVREDDGLWKSFLLWLAKRGRVDTVLLHVSAGDLVGRRSDELELLGGQLQRRLWEVAQQLRADMPLHLMVSQCDRLDGFVRFFAELPESERVAPWGLGLAGAAELQLLGPRVRESFAELLAALLARTGEPFRRARTLDEQAAVLAFPQEAQRLGEALARFVDVLYPRGPGEGRPRLQEICLASALQEGQLIPGSRYELSVEGQLIRFAPAAAAPLLTVGPFFLRQPLQRVQARALAVSRPRLRWHVVSLGVTSVFCAGVGMLLGRSLAHHLDWLERTQEAVQALQSLPPLSRGSDEQLVLTELEKEETLRQQVCHTVRRGDSVPDCVAKELTRAAHERAVTYLECRIGSQFVKPLSTYDSSTTRPNELYSRLKTLAGWRKGQSGRGLLQGFNALKATTLLQKRNTAPPRCPQPTGEDQRWLSEYLASLWGHERAYGEPLRRNLGLFVKLYLQGEPASLHWGFDQARVDMARDNLRAVFGGPSGSSDAEMLFYLSASELGLFSGKPLLSGQTLKDEQRIDPVYTAAGCASFFNPKGQWDRWMSCVRDDDPGAQVQPQRVRSSLSNYYLAAHRRAWIAWLNALQPGKDIKADDPVGAGDALPALGLELRQALLLMGRGTTRKGEGKDKDPETCLEARRALGFFPFAAGEALEIDQDGAPLQLGYNKYQEALGKAAAALKALSEWRPDPAQNSLKPSDDALQALAELGRRRAELIAALGGAGARLSQNLEAGEGGEALNVPLQVDGLNRVLAGFEEEGREVVITKLRGYLQARWDALYGEWMGLRPKSGEEASNPDLAASMRLFVNEKLAPFMDGCVVPLYYPELASCRLKPPIGDGKRRILCATSCQTLSRARALAGRPLAAPVPAPAAPPPAAPVSYLDPIVDIPECAGQPQEVWINTRELGLRYRCEASTGICKTAGAATGPASLTVTYLPSRRSATIATADQFIPLAARHKVQPNVRRADRVLTLFPGPGSCQIRLFLDPAMTVVRPAGPAPVPRGPVSPLLTLSLPDRLVCQQ